MEVPLMMAAPPHDGRKGHHYYRRWLHRPMQTCRVVMALAAILTMTHKFKEKGHRS